MLGKNSKKETIAELEAERDKLKAINEEMLHTLERCFRYGDLHSTIRTEAATMIAKAKVI